MSGGAGNADGDVGFQIAPMIDLILVLMVFFMSTVALKQVENELGITLPGTGVGSTEGAKEAEVNISITPDESVNVNGTVVGEKADKELKGLVALLAEQVKLFGQKTPVTINPEGDVPHRRVIDVLNACATAKIQNVSFGGG